MSMRDDYLSNDFLLNFTGVLVFQKHGNKGDFIILMNM